MERAIGEGDLSAGARTDLLSMAMLQLGGGAFGAWVADLITLEQMELQTSYGLARLLLSVARPAGRAKLQARIDAIEAAPSPDLLRARARKSRATPA